jgi:hypothetical protein
MSMEGVSQFMQDIGVNIENCESLLACYILEFSTFIKITFQEFEKALVSNNCS